jgi:hypothetical protein
VRTPIAGHGLSLDPSEDWRIDDPWSDPSVQRDHGVYLTNIAEAVSVHVRGHLSRSDLDLEGMRSLVREQNWPPPIFDEESDTHDGLTWAAATWDTNERGNVVREYFVTDGRRVANLALVGAPERVLRATPSVTRLVRSLRFD